MFDFFIDEMGEISKNDEKIDINRARYQYVFCNLYSVNGDWYGAPLFGCNIESYIGRVVNSEGNVEKDIINSLSCELINKSDLFIEKTINNIDVEYKLYVKDFKKDLVYKAIPISFYGFII